MRHRTTRGLLRLLFGICVLTLALRAQVVRTWNAGEAVHDGWVRAVVDAKPKHSAGVLADGSLYVLGRQRASSWVVDVLQVAGAGEDLAHKLASEHEALEWKLRELPGDPVSYFGGVVTCAGVPLPVLDVAPDGAAWTAHFRGRVGRMLVAHVWVRWYPDRPALMHGEGLVVASNPSVPDMAAVIDRDVHVRFGDAVTVLPGAGVAQPVLRAGDTLADGQGRAVPMLFVWPRRLASARDWSVVGAHADEHLGAVGVAQLIAQGNPRLAEGFSARAWAVTAHQKVLRALHSWEPAIYGPAANSGQTGSQEDQVFVRGEALAPDGAGAERIAYLSALKLAARPCHHCEADGRPLDPDAHVQPRLIMWDSRAHFSESVSPDRLGKPRGLTREEAHGWSGADVEHAFWFTLFAADRLVDSPACQYLIDQLARIYPLQWTATPGWSTSQPYAARAIAWECLAVVGWDRQLNDRARAMRTVLHWRTRMDTITLPYLRARGDWWDVRRDDPRLGPGLWAIAWQQAAGAYGLDVAGEHLGHAGARAVALVGARAVVRDAWQQSSTGRWVSAAQLRVDGTGGTFDESFDYFGMSMAVATVLRHDPADEKARAIWTQLVSEVRGDMGRAKWLAPEVK